MDKKFFIFFLIVAYSIIGSIPIEAQICMGNLGTYVYFNNFGSNSAVYAPSLPAGQTQYPYVTGIPPNGSYVISYTSNPSGVLPPQGAYVHAGDHTGNPNGCMMVINSDYSPDTVYTTHVTGLCPNTTYVFSSYLANNDDPTQVGPVCGSSYIYANVKMQIEYPIGTVEGSVTTGNLPLASNSSSHNWIQAGFVFTTVTGQTSVDLVMINNAPGGCGNDYVVDDISLSPCGPGMALSVIPNQTIFCAGQALTLQAAYTSGSYVNPQYQWQFSNNNGLTWTNVAGATSLTYPISSVTASQGGMYQLVAAENGNINSSSCSILAGPISFSVSSQVSITNGTASSVCSSTTADTLTATGATTYSWSTGATTNSIVVNPSSTTNYTVTGTTGTCTSQAASTISVTPVSTVTVSGNHTICAGKNITLTVTGANSYIWSTGATTAAVTLNPSATTTYTVIGSVGTCTSQAVVTVTVNPNPIPVITGNTDICQGQNTSLTASGSTLYSWNTGATTANITLFPLSTTNYTVIGTTGTCTNQTIATVSVTPNPTVSITGNLSVCMGNQTILTASGASNYSWSTGASTAALNVNPIIYTTYTVIGAIGTCTGQAVASVSVNPLPVVSITGNTVVCLGQNTALTAGGANTYTWNTGATTAGIVVNPTLNISYTVMGTIGTCTNQATINIITSNISLTGNNIICQGKNTTLVAHGSAGYLWSTGATTSNIAVSPTVTTTYTVLGTTGTCTTQAVDTVFVNSIPYVSIAGDTIICSGQSTTLTANGASAYVWSTGSALPSITISPKITTHYGIIGTTGTCTYQTVETVYVNPSPKAVYIVDPNPANTLTPLVSFTNQSLNYTHWWWNFGDNSPEDSADVNPTHYYNTESGGSYATSLTLINQYGCKDEVEVVLVIEPQFSFYIPNTFTPNNDGRNEVFTGVGTGIETYEIWIFDRWGTCIYSSNDINKGWDGNIKNKQEIAQQDVYVWKVEIKDMLEKNHQYSGTVTLIK